MAKQFDLVFRIGGSQHPSYVSSSSTTSQYKLLEVPESLLEEIKKDNKTVSIKGNPNDEAVLCTSEHTYSLKLAESSNSMLLIPGKLIQENERQYIVGTLSSHFELIEIAPRLKALRDFLSEHLYVDNSEQEDNDESKGKLYTFEKLLSLIQASEAELTKGLQKIHALKVGPYWRLLSPTTQLRTCDSIVTTIIAKDWDFTCVPFEECKEELKELCSPIVLQHCLKVILGKDKDHKAPDVMEDFVTQELDPEKIAIFRATQILTMNGSLEVNENVWGEKVNREHWRLGEFLTAWKDSVPDAVKTSLGENLNMDLLRGLAITIPNANLSSSSSSSSDSSSLLSSVRYFPTFLLPGNAKDRFRALFTTKPRWNLQEIEPYLQELIEPGSSLEQLPLKFARPITGKGMRNFCSRE
eukprot:TRINITY_DN8644_c0_g1_i3.p1 TRINITY_DN8644_c0_g1~~TRINITY_DN8644_c0_g1_i3.p1  ORF type:complete len:412 (+),score=86.80 TRINITY_DN8644_c0_g1_i3:232-1467(+)